VPRRCVQLVQARVAEGAHLARCRGGRDEKALRSAS
jgi:hypothetical protein